MNNNDLIKKHLDSYDKELFNFVKFSENFIVLFVQNVKVHYLFIYKPSLNLLYSIDLKRDHNNVRIININKPMKIYHPIKFQNMKLSNKQKRFIMSILKDCVYV